MARHHWRKRIQLEIKIRVPRSDHLVINKFAFRSQMAFQAFPGAMNHVSSVVHSQRHGFLVRPQFCRVWPQPRRRWPVAVFAGYAFRNFKRASALLRRRIKRVARQALGSFFRLGAQFQDARDAFTNFTGQRLIRAAVLVLDDPR